MNHTFTLDHDALFDVSQFVSCLNNKLIACNDDFAKQIGFNPVTFESFREQMIEELRAYKVYDC